jgi:hypothetical protein
MLTSPQLPTSLIPLPPTPAHHKTSTKAMLLTSPTCMSPAALAKAKPPTASKATLPALRARPPSSAPPKTTSPPLDLPPHPLTFPSAADSVHAAHPCPSPCVHSLCHRHPPHPVLCLHPRRTHRLRFLHFADGLTKDTQNFDPQADVRNVCGLGSGLRGSACPECLQQLGVRQLHELRWRWQAHTSGGPVSVHSGSRCAAVVLVK